MKRPGRMIREVLHSSMRKPVTVRYPFVKVTMPDRFRGKLAFDAAKCIGCKICERDCPSAAITIRKVGDKRFEADIDMAKCIYCAQCVDSCPKKVLVSTGEFELAQIQRDKLRLTYEALPAPPAAPAASPAPASVSEKKPASPPAAPPAAGATAGAAADNHAQSPKKSDATA